MIDKILKEKPVYNPPSQRSSLDEDPDQTQNTIKSRISRTTPEKPLFCPIHVKNIAEYFCTEEHCK